jgi:peptidylprolyl isomerase
LSESGDRVYILYKGSLSNGEEFDTNLDDPYEIILGRHQVFQPLESALREMSVGEERTLAISAADAYGDYQQDAVQQVDTELVSNGAMMREGEMILWENPRTTQPIPTKVLKVDGRVATLDFNHPLAGKNLTYWIKVVEIIPDKLSTP